ncbi:microcystin-dependent protein [Massilia sp. MP_M2]|uniref:phage tail protein n=1 Tax=Massilia sp. MP_M2 TaxID=3071713 RepID=UPI00319D8CCC
MDPILGQIILWPVPWVPLGWALCDGSLLPINQNQALYTLLGNYFGGDGQQTFALPDLRGRFPMGAQGVTNIAQKGGAATANMSGASGVGSVTIGVNNLPAHSHGAAFTGAAAASVSVAVPIDAVGAATDSVPGPGKVLGCVTGGLTPPKLYTTDTATSTLLPFDVALPAAAGTIAVSTTGAGQPLPVQVALSGAIGTVPPYTTLNFIIATQGIYPSRP